MRVPDEIAGEAAPDHGSGEDLDRIIRRLVDGQLYGVLCTQGQGQPYGSLVAYAMTPDLDSAVFATQKATRKYRLLSECAHVALVVDNRSALPGQLMDVEAVPGPCALLVDGSVDPDRWVLTRTSGELLEWRPGRRGSDIDEPLLDARDLEHLLGVISRIETLFAWPPDVEWTGRAPDTGVLQARPITANRPDAEDERGWYLLGGQRVL